MKNHLITLQLITFILLSAAEVSAQNHSADTINADEYRVSDKMLRENDSISYSMKSAGVYSRDKIWFTNKGLKQTLIFEVHTDYYRLETFHFMNENIPDELLEQLELHVIMSQYNNIFDLASLEQKRTAMPGFISEAKRIDKPYFVTKKDLVLGDKKSKAIKIYGKPDTSYVSEDNRILEWKFMGDKGPLMADTSKIVRNSYGYSVTMFFQSDKLIAMILRNEMP